MIPRRAFLAAVAAPLARPAGAFQSDGQRDALLESLLAELERARELRLENLERPYFVEYAVHDMEAFYAGATLGALAESRIERLRLPRIRVRVGSYDFDNTNYVFSDSMTGAPYALSYFPLEDHPAAIRRHLWLATDLVYRSALQILARKRAAVRNLTLGESLPDFARAEPVRMILAPRRQIFQPKEWEGMLRSLSAELRAYPEVTASGVEFQISTGMFYLVNTEGAQIRIPENVARFQVRANALAEDGMPLRDSAIFLAHEFRDLPGEPELRQAVRSVGENLRALVRAPLADNYLGPVLFEPQAAAQLLADLLGRNLGWRRRPISEPGRPVPFADSELEGRLGTRILPEWIDIVDDPTAEQWEGKRLFGSYPVDLEGVVPRRLVIVEKGILKAMLGTRQPVKGQLESNGRARLYGSYGANAAAFGNLFVQAAQRSSMEELRKRLLELCAQRNRPYGLVVRKLDFPSTASGAEFQRMAARLAQGGGSRRVVSAPLLAYRVYPDGREELVRGLQFRELTVRSLRDIVAAGGDPVAFDYLENGAPMALTGASAFVAECSVVAPGLLFEEVQLERPTEEFPRLPIVPRPPLEANL